MKQELNHWRLLRVATFKKADNKISLELSVSASSFIKMKAEDYLNKIGAKVRTHDGIGEIRYKSISGERVITYDLETPQVIDSIVNEIKRYLIHDFVS